MKPKRVGFALMAACAVALPLAARGQAQTSRLISAADVARVGKLAGVHLVPATARGAVPGEDNYADGSGKIVLWVHEFPAALFARAKAQPAKMMSGIQVEPRLFHAAVPGLGDEAFDSPDGPLRHAIYVRKGARAFALTANIVPGPSGDHPTLSMTQLKALAVLALSRM